MQRVDDLALRYLLAEDHTAGKYDGISFKPPESVANAAAKGLEYRQKAAPSNRGGLTTEEAGKQGIGSGVQRATSLKNRTNVSPKVIGQMVAFFARHEKNKSVDPKHKSEPWNDKGHVAWLLWGGDPGKAWAEKVKKQMDAADEKAKQAALNMSKKQMETLHKDGEVTVDGEVITYKEAADSVIAALEDACWDGYEAIGMKEQDGRVVPNCVPKKAFDIEARIERLLWGGDADKKAAARMIQIRLSPKDLRGLDSMMAFNYGADDIQKQERIVGGVIKRTDLHTGVVSVTPQELELLAQWKALGQGEMDEEAGDDFEPDPRAVRRYVQEWKGRGKTAKSNAKVVDVPNTFHQVVVQPPKAKRKEFPFEGFIDFQGLQIDVEYAKGSTRRGTGPEGDWSTFMHAHYGEIRGTEGTDGDKLDVYVGDNHDASLVVVIHQHNPWDGTYDEDKVVLGCESVEEAIGLYKKQYDRPGFYREGEHTVMPIGAFWRWVHEDKNMGKKVKVAKEAIEMADTPVLAVENRKGYAMLQSGGTIKTLTDALNMHMVRRVPPPGQVPRVRGAAKAFSFHWSNAQAKWSVITAPSGDFPWGIDGAEFILFVAKTAVSPLGKVWTLPEMKYVAQGLQEHPGYAWAVKAASAADDVIAALNGEWKDQIPGGLGDKKKPSDFDSVQLDQGEKIEMEHTSDPAMAREVAMDHLTEDPRYYKKLQKYVEPTRQAALKVAYATGEPKEIKEAQESLSALLGTLRAMQWNHLTSHWQVGGDASYGDHLLFQRLYEKTVEETDGLAEKLVGTFGVNAVDAREQGNLMNMALNRMSEIGDPVERALHFERMFQIILKDCLDVLESLGQLSLGLDDLLRTMANDHETHIYLLQQKQTGQGGLRLASANKRADQNRRERAFAARCLLRMPFGKLR